MRRAIHPPEVDEAPERDRDELVEQRRLEAAEEAMAEASTSPTTTYRFQHPTNPECYAITTSAWIAEGLSEAGWRVTAVTEGNDG